MLWIENYDWTWIKLECIPVGCVPPAHWQCLIVSVTHTTTPAMHAPTMHAPCHAHAPTMHASPAMHTPRPCMPPPATHTLLLHMPHPHGENSWHTLLKILPCPHFVAGGKNLIDNNRNEALLDYLKDFSFLIVPFHMTYTGLSCNCPPIL